MKLEFLGLYGFSVGKPHVEAGRKGMRECQEWESSSEEHPGELECHEHTSAGRTHGLTLQVLCDPGEAE